MASRRDELNAYTFARKRTVGAFLLPGGGGNDEDAPRPVKAVLPSVIVGTLIVGGFGLWGAFKPSAPLNWDSTKNIIQGKTSYTRYVVLLDDDKKTKRLHQVLNMSSARLVVPADAKVVVVADKVLDAYPNHGATIGIPYAPDKLPTKAVAGQPMKWSVCNKPGPDDKRETVNQAVFVAGGADAKDLEAKNKVLDTDQSLLVQEVDEAQVNGQQGAPTTQSELELYLVDSQGRKHAIGGTQTSDQEKKALVTAIFGESAVPQRVKKDWLATLQRGVAISFPQVPGMNPAVKTANSKVALHNVEDRKIGRLVKYGEKYYVVGESELFPITQFQSMLLLRNPALQYLYNQDKDTHPRIDELTPEEQSNFGQGLLTDNKLKLPDDWPAKAGEPVNNWTAAKDRKEVVCSTFEGVAEDGKTPRRSVWVGTEYPGKYTGITASARVTAGFGLFYRALDNEAGGSGSSYLITETGLRYAVQANGDGGRKKAATPQPGQSSPPAAADQQPAQQGQPEAGNAQARLGYNELQPALVPREWSDLVPSGPALSEEAASQEQDS
ncbi:type VII secretion protein EccB [Kitasatospora sp. NBC_00240]|uniref:type VII secretion protein EccB n=1 Tax=Kitasatospora sp. NBC_00240 TaxID=2903567 RepID=UPI00224E4266|nr:type VII secretion protein EccB [Kitasatospora sp. NBC_00240]MCX5212857.1 type VII secretion protein EccB [Kitasatospora sp. NBC_00240]